MSFVMFINFVGIRFFWYFLFSFYYRQTFSDLKHITTYIHILYLMYQIISKIKLLVHFCTDPKSSIYLKSKTNKCHAATCILSSHTQPIYIYIYVYIYKQVSCYYMYSSLPYTIK